MDAVFKHFLKNWFLFIDGASDEPGRFCPQSNFLGHTLYCECIVKIRQASNSISKLVFYYHIKENTSWDFDPDILININKLQDYSKLKKLRNEA